MYLSYLQWHEAKWLEVCLFVLAIAGTPSIMSRQRGKRGNCSVVGCTEQHKSLHQSPASGDRRAE